MEIETSATSGWPEPPDSGQVLPLEPDSSILINGEAIIRTEASAEDAVMSSHASSFASLPFLRFGPYVYEPEFARIWGGGPPEHA
jgi:hypothetical protein